MNIYPSKKPLAFAAAVEGLVVLMVIGGVIWFKKTDNLLMIAGPVLVLFSAIYGAIALRLKATKLTITDSQLSLEQGLVGKDKRAFDLTKIQDVRSEQSIVDRMLGMGTVIHDYLTR